MLSKAERLTVHDIQALSQGKSVFTTLISMRYIPTVTTKVSVTVSKKVAKTAVSRNRIRRRLYTATAPLLPLIKKPSYILLMPKAECATIPFETLKNEVKNIYIKAGLFQ